MKINDTNSVNQYLGDRNIFDVSVGEVGPFNPAGLDNCEKLFGHIR